MRLFACDACRSVLFFEDLECRGCGREVGFLPAPRRMAVLAEGVVPANSRNAMGKRHYRCSNRNWGCNWLVPDDAGAGQCESCLLTRRRPDLDDTIGMEQLALTWEATRRLVFQLRELGLPVVSHLDRPEGGLAFDLVSSTSGERVMIGHANGIITIDISETSDPHREALRAMLDESYRTMLGHFRHEIGHYYWQTLVWEGGRVEAFREAFGDEQADYAKALDVHYRYGAPQGWEENYLSQYATTHPWEDFAETFANFLHAHDTLQTAASFGVSVRLPEGEWTDDERDRLTSRPQPGTVALDIAQLMHVGRPLTLAINQVSRSMGQKDLYPFRTNPAILAKLTWIHDLVIEVALKGA